MRDKLFLIQPGFKDQAYPGGDIDSLFYCPYCATIEGVLAQFPELTDRIDVERVPFARPRQALIDLVGEENQGLPRLILAPNAPDGIETGSKDGVRFVSDVKAILDALSKRHGIPLAHF